jgi:chemotaxis signal transduction protein
MDLRLRFGIPSINYTERSCIIVVEIADDTGTILIGIAVEHCLGSDCLKLIWHYNDFAVKKRLNEFA